jgi:uncharacterized protein YjlB
MNEPKVQTFYLKDDGIMPNNPDLPVILYQGALKNQERQAEKIFNQHNWTNSWTNGVFDYHHYHSDTHEVLGVISGSAVLQLGGEQGQSVELQAGDVAVLPAGTAHKRLSSSSNFRIVGAYPNGMEYNLYTGKAGERTKALEEMKHVPVPGTDPVFGETGPLLEHWSKNESTIILPKLRASKIE